MRPIDELGSDDHHEQPPSPMIPDRLVHAIADRYRIERELGAGGMATVYLAEDLKHDRKVAIKVLKPELAAVLGAERFVVEIKTTAALQHPHILPLFDSGTADGFLFYVMPYIQGETIREKLNRETQCGVEEAVRITREVADALDYAHRHGVIHRDIKPENLLLHDGRAMVMDFGIALAVSAAAGGRMTETGLSLGTPHYMSPEQATAEKEISGRSDVYSLASVLYEMLAGQPPHLGGSAQQIIMKIIAEPVALVTTLRKSVPPNVADALAKALEKLPADRFSSASAFADALVNEHFTVATSRRASVAATRKRWGVLIGALAGVAALSFAAAWRMRGAPAAVNPSAPIYRFMVAEPEGFASIGAAETILPDGSGFSMLVDGPAGRGVVVQSFDGSPPRFFAAPGAAIGNSFLPDNSGVLTYAFPGGSASQVQIVPFSGAPPRVWTDSLRFGLAVDKAGWLYGAHLTQGGLTRVDASGKTTEILTKPDTAAGERIHAFPKFVDDGRVLAFTILHSDDRPVRLGFFDLRRRIVHRSVEGVSPAMLPNGYLVYGTDAGVLMAGRVDLTTLDFASAPTPVLRGLQISGTSISTSGSLLYRPKGDSRWSLRRSGADSDDTGFSADGERVSALRFRPDGRALLTLEGARSLWVRSRDGASRQLIVPARTHRIAGWSADGARLLYVEYNGRLTPTSTSTTHGTLAFLSADGTGSPEPVGRGTGNIVREADWGHGGIAYTNMDGMLWWLADGQEKPIKVAETQRGTGSGAFTMPAVSPDGKFIAYRDSGSTLVVKAIPPATGSWIVGLGTNPRWTRDGKYLYFGQPIPPYQTTAVPVMRVPVTLGAAFSNGKAEVASAPPATAAQQWDLGPDNSVYWVTQRRRTQSLLVVNWAREVDSLVRAAKGGKP